MTLRPTTIEADGAVLAYSLVPWDSEVFGFPVAQIDHVVFEAGRSPDEVFAQFEGWCAENDVGLVSCRLDHTQLRESMILEDHGFRFIETVYEPRLASFDRIAVPGHAIDVAEAGPDDLPRIEAIAYDAFDTGRFLLDWRLPPDLSRRRYANWVATSVGVPGRAVLKAEVEGELIGFFIVEHQADDGVYWHLTAVAPGWQGRGLGLSLWRTMLLRHQAEGAASVGTTISGHNLAAINLYARLGFTFATSRLTLHRLRGRGPS